MGGLLHRWGHDPVPRGMGDWLPTKSDGDQHSVSE